MAGRSRKGKKAAKRLETRRIAYERTGRSREKGFTMPGSYKK